MTHPATAALLPFFEYGHLPPHLAEVSQPFHDLAHNLAEHPDMNGPEVTVGLRKLLEAKDAAVRAMVAGPARVPASRPSIVINVTVPDGADQDLADHVAQVIADALDARGLNQ
ncbi:MAG: hypothetical protein RR101_15395 [Burkholderiaceae bacterium]